MSKYLSKNLFIFLFLFSFIYNCKLSDLRTLELKNNDPAPYSIGKASAILKKTLTVYGGMKNWLAKKSMSVIFREEWHGFFLKNFGMPWHKNKQKIQFFLLIGTDNSRLRFLEDPYKNHEWGIQNWLPYTKEPDGPIEFDDDRSIKFFLPTNQFLIESVFRLSNTGLAVYGGERIFEKKKYDLILVSWNTIKPQEDLDQYLLWINQQNNRVEIIQYTVREFLPGIVGTVLFGDFRRVDGILIPFELNVVYGLEEKETARKISIESVKFSQDLPDDFFIPSPLKKGSKY